MTSALPAAAAVEQDLLRRWPESRLEPSLERIRAVTEALGRPQDAVPVVHLTGTNGKTTTARVVDDLLRGSGLRVGRYTSPHLETMRERIVVDGAPLDEDRFTAVHARLRPVLERVEARVGGLSFFEAVTAMAFLAFAEAGLDAVVLEVGMGGTWDATNVADGRVAVVTPISLDHTEYLGPDEAAIAREKAGIVKPGSVAVVADQPAPALPVLLDRAREVGAPVLDARREVRVLRRTPRDDGQLLDLRGEAGDHRDLFLPLLGLHQAGNAATAVTAAEAFLAAGGRGLGTDTVREVLAQVRSPGRLETVRGAPRTWVDASHNPAGMAATLAAVRELGSVERVLVVLAVLADKDVVGMLHALRDPAVEVVASENTSPRRLPAADLGAAAAEVLGADRVTVEPDLAGAVRSALDRASDGVTAVLVTGSVVTAGEAAALLRSQRPS
ncbi:bifunctional folylpolyglutamate synthase/dihydrofolate synthase [Geodermatophilus sp. CPCC 206100]|uniref:bifunctional folylpolyglutamate synthase/dihydrofolate synthase n=1 Tax=Geodermatophilus sp. CPCC 206100 TaxID=3020054 RepID=UPI003B000265